MIKYFFHALLLDDHRSVQSIYKTAVTERHELNSGIYQIVKEHHYIYDVYKKVPSIILIGLTGYTRTRAAM